jgi:hypothetical protein
MRLHPPGFGGARTPPDQIKRDGWRNHGVLVVSLEDQRLSWPERELLRQLGTRLYGARKEVRHG